MVLIRSAPLIAAGWLACRANISSWAARRRLRLTNGGAQVVIGDRNTVEVLEFLLERAALLVPALTLIGTVAALRQVQGVCALELVEQLIHLLLAVRTWSHR